MWDRLPNVGIVRQPGQRGRFSFELGEIPIESEHGHRTLSKVNASAAPKLEENGPDTEHPARSARHPQFS
jgi:hypothetical protein